MVKVCDFETTTILYVNKGRFDPGSIPADGIIILYFYLFIDVKYK